MTNKIHHELVYLGRIYPMIQRIENASHNELIDLYNHLRDPTFRNFPILPFDKEGNKEVNSYSHPEIGYSFGCHLLSYNEIGLALDAFQRCAFYGISYPSTYYDTLFAHGIGCSFKNLSHWRAATENDNFTKMLFHKHELNSSNVKAFALAYLFFSKCINTLQFKAWDSYKLRGDLIYEYRTSIRTISDLLGRDANLELLMLSDWYSASTHIDSPHNINGLENIEKALITKHPRFSKSRMSFLDFLMEGDAAHQQIILGLENKYKNGEFDLSLRELFEFD